MILLHWIRASVHLVVPQSYSRRYGNTDIRWNESNLPIYPIHESSDKRSRLGIPFPLVWSRVCEVTSFCLNFPKYEVHLYRVDPLRLLQDTTATNQRSGGWWRRHLDYDFRWYAKDSTEQPVITWQRTIKKIGMITNLSKLHKDIQKSDTIGTTQFV